MSKVSPCLPIPGQPGHDKQPTIGSNGQKLVNANAGTSKRENATMPRKQISLYIRCQKIQIAHNPNLRVLETIDKSIRIHMSSRKCQPLQHLLDWSTKTRGPTMCLAHWKFCLSRCTSLQVSQNSRINKVMD